MSLPTRETQLNTSNSFLTMRPNRKPNSLSRGQFTKQTGDVLVTLGTVFKFVPPFNDHIDENTGQMLIKLGKKLKSAK